MVARSYTGSEQMVGSMQKRGIISLYSKTIRVNAISPIPNDALAFHVKSKSDLVYLRWRPISFLPYAVFTSSHSFFPACFFSALEIIAPLGRGGDQDQHRSANTAHHPLN